MGVCSRLGGLPAAEYADGSKAWYVMGYQHRDGDLPAVELIDGTMEWWINGAWIRTLTADGRVRTNPSPKRKEFLPKIKRLLKDAVRIEAVLRAKSEKPIRVRKGKASLQEDFMFDAILTVDCYTVGNPKVASWEDLLFDENATVFMVDWFARHNKFGEILVVKDGILMAYDFGDDKFVACTSVAVEFQGSSFFLWRLNDSLRGTGVDFTLSK